MEFLNPNNNNNKSNPSLETQLGMTPNGQTLDPLEDYDSTCSTPYVSAPSSPGRAPFHNSYGNCGFYYSAPASPMHFAITSSKVSSSTQPSSPDNNSTFEFSARYESSSGSVQTGSMSSADELFLNGKIRPMKLSTHLERPQALAPLVDLEHEEEDEDRRLRDKSLSLRRRTRSMSPCRSNAGFGLTVDDQTQGPDKADSNETSASTSAASSRSSSAGRSSKRWVFLKDFLRSKSEGTGRSSNNNSKFWSSISFSPTIKEKKAAGNKEKQRSNKISNKLVNGVLKRRVPVPPSPHELHYTANRAQAEEMRKKTFLPYRQGLLGCLGFSSKGYGAMNGFCRALNPVSYR